MSTFFSKPIPLKFNTFTYKIFKSITHIILTTLWEIITFFYTITSPFTKLL